MDVFIEALNVYKTESTAFKTIMWFLNVYTCTDLPLTYVFRTIRIKTKNKTETDIT